MRVTAGEYRGRELKTPDNATTHPMGSREKLALFNAVTALKGSLKVCNAVLDCYCGSGALGIEALSRGVKKAIFVDKNRLAVEITKENLASLGLLERTEVFKADIAKVSEVIRGEYDLILVDPPYDHFLVAEFREIEKFLAPGGVLVLSHPKEYQGETVNLAEIFQKLRLYSDRSYARANIAIFR